MIFTTDNYDIAFETFREFYRRFYDEEVDGICTLSGSSEHSDFILVLHLNEADIVKLETLYTSFMEQFAQIKDSYQEEEDE